MNIVIDSNRVIAALIKSGTTREILFYREFNFVAPEFLKDEIEKHRGSILSKADLPSKEFEILLSFVFENITFIPRAEYQQFLSELITEISDPNDISYIGVALLTEAEGIWTHDPHFKQQQKMKVFTNIDLLKLSGMKRKE